MEQGLVRALEEGAIQTRVLENFVVLPARAGDGSMLPIGREVALKAGDSNVTLTLPPLGELFKGDRLPPRFEGEPPLAYRALFFVVENALAHYVDAAGVRPTDAEFEKLFSALASHPEREHAEPMLSHAQAAMRLALSFREFSRAELVAVARRLEGSARTFRTSSQSTNYHDRVLRGFVGDAPGWASGPQEPIRRLEPKVGRNDPCPCGSGKKFKKCHGG